MAHLKFDPSKLEKLNDPGRLDTLKPDVMWEALAVARPRVLIEIGAGTGLFAAEFARRAPEARVYAVDTSEKMLSWMRDNRPEVAEGRIVVVASSEERVPLEDGWGDAVYMINLHHELAAPEGIYAEAYRVLRPQGRVLVADWAPLETPKGPPLHVRASAEVLGEHLKNAGFARVREHPGLPWHSLLTATRPEGA